jgi:hypothetical protein
MISKCRKELFQFHASHPYCSYIFISLALSPSFLLSLSYNCVYVCIPPLKIFLHCCCWLYTTCFSIYPLVTHLNVISREEKSCRKDKTFLLNFKKIYTIFRDEETWKKYVPRVRRKIIVMYVHIHTKINWNRPQFYVYKIMALIYHNY